MGYTGSKYQVNGFVQNIITGNTIPDNEPIFILRAQDAFAVGIMRQYSMMTDDPLTVTDEIVRFKDWQVSHNVKVPD